MSVLKVLDWWQSRVYHRCPIGLGSGLLDDHGIVLEKIDNCPCAMGADTVVHENRLDCKWMVIKMWYYCNIQDIILIPFGKSLVYG